LTSPTHLPVADLTLSTAEVAEKAGQTEWLLQSLAQRDPLFEPFALRHFVRGTFTLVHTCWQERDYGPVQERLLPSISAEHERRLRSMRQNHEISRIEGLHVGRVDFVQLSCLAPPATPEVTALITFAAQVYFVDDRTGAYIRGERRYKWFQEFWVFCRQGDAWRLYAIERSHESTRLRAENRVAGIRDAEPRTAQQGVIIL
jgi:hypothetical protein